MGFTAVDVARKALELAEANPDFVYPTGSCVYVESEHDEKGSCLFGQALVALGASPERLAEYPNLSIPAVLREEFGVDLPPSQAGLLQMAQHGQDEAHNWGSEDVAGYLRTFLREAE